MNHRSDGMSELDACEVVQDLLLDAGRDALTRRPELLNHFSSCVSCQEIERALTTVDRAFTEALEYNPTHSVASSTISRVERDIELADSRRIKINISWRAFAVVAIFLVLLLLVVAFVDDIEDVNLILNYLEGSFGALFMSSFLIAAAVSAALRRFRGAGGLLAAGLCCFFVRANMSTFFNDTGIHGGSEISRQRVAPDQDAASQLSQSRYVFYDRRIGSSEDFPSISEALEAANDDAKGDSASKEGKDLQRYKLGSGRAEEFRVAKNQSAPKRIDKKKVAEKQELQGKNAELVFEEPRGYWQNTYVPGDPLLRHLAHVLENSDRAIFEKFLGRKTLLHEEATRPNEPFDQPGDSAIQLYTSSSAAFLGNESRFLMQVGLKGVNRQSGVRAPMKVAVVLDLRDASFIGQADAFAAVLRGLVKLQAPGDQVSVVVAGRPGGTIIRPGDFRYGTVEVAIESLLSNDGTRPIEKGPVYSLVEALDAGIVSVKGSDTADSPLGTSLTLLVTGGRLLGDTDTIVAHSSQSATAGIPVSVIGIGTKVSTDELDRVVLAGQGNRRLINGASEVQEAISRELFAVSKVVARALRLNIKLAPGVKFVGILGSQRLTEEASEAAKRVEQAIDERLARTLGISGDRVSDDDGIQILIPTFLAGDSHVILLDLIAERPGKIADVSLKYKDLFLAKNGVGHSELSLTSEPRTQGPLEVNVRKNEIAFRLSMALKTAGEALASGDSNEAKKVLRAAAESVRQTIGDNSLLQGDSELRKDLSLLSDYESLILQASLNPALSKQLANSLIYSGMLKVLPRPEIT